MSYTIKSNTSENRLYITVNGVFKMEDVKPFSEKLFSEASKLKKGWTCLQDVRQNIMDPEVVQYLAPNKEKSIKMGMGKNAYVVNSAVLKGQMKRICGNPDAKEVEDKYFSSIEEAVKYLNS